MTSAANPIGAGLVASLARPGGNVTGFTAQSVELNTKRLEILNDAVPKLGRVGLLWTPAAGPGNFQLKEIKPAALALKLKLDEIEAQADPKDLERAFQTAKQKQVGAIMTTSNRRFFAERKRIVELADKYRLPAIYFDKGFVEEGGLMFYGTEYDDLYRRAAVYVDKILKGAKPADLPVQQATKFEFVINLKTAKQIGLTALARHVAVDPGADAARCDRRRDLAGAPHHQQCQSVLARLRPAGAGATPGGVGVIDHRLVRLAARAAAAAPRRPVVGTERQPPRRDGEALAGHAYAPRGGERHHLFDRPGHPADCTEGVSTRRPRRAG